MKNLPFPNTKAKEPANGNLKVAQKIYQKLIQPLTGKMASSKPSAGSYSHLLCHCFEMFFAHPNCRY